MSEEEHNEQKDTSRSPLNTAKWRTLPALVRDVICLILDTAENAGEVFDMVEGDVVIVIQNSRASAIRQSRQLRRGKELPHLPPQPQRIILHRDPSK